MSVLGIDHFQLAAPADCENEARRFFGDLLGLSEVSKPEALAARGGAWFQAGEQQIHVCVEAEFAPASKAHPALLVEPSLIEDLAERLAQAGAPVAWDDELAPRRRFYSADPWGNRIELIAAIGAGDRPAETDADVTVRRCRHDDVDAVVDLWALARSGHASTPDRREDVESLVEGSPAALLVAESAERVVGVVIAAWDGWRGNIYRLAVADGYRRQGVGLQLIRAAEDYFRGHGVGRITALVADDDAAAGSFWDAAAYPRDVKIGRRVRNI